MSTAPAALIDALLPRFDEVERHAILIAASPPVVWAALHRVDLLASPVIRTLLLLRSAPSILLGRRRAPSEPLTLARIVQGGFVPLGERAPRELVLGAVGQFWRPTAPRARVDAVDFVAFAEPGYAKVAWDFRLADEARGTRLTTETRIVCTDAASRRRFRLYWRVIRPFSGLLRLALLRAVAREVTRSAGPSPSRR
jgi:hypothetical protein